MDPRQRTLILVALGVFLLVATVVGILVLGVLRAAPEPTATAEQPARERPPEPDASPTGSGAAVAPTADEGARGKDAAPMPLIVRKDGVQRVSCDAACRLEDECGLRERGACVAQACEGEVRKVNRSDFLLGSAKDCADLALSACEEACWRRGECAGAHGDDARCTAACQTLGKQVPRDVWQESRCVLETACADLALCGGVPASAPADPAPG